MGLSDSLPIAMLRSLATKPASRGEVGINGKGSNKRRGTSANGAQYINLGHRPQVRRHIDSQGL